MAEQDYAWIEGECVFDDLGSEKATALGDLIRQQPVRPTKAWGEPIVEGGKVRAMLRYGPVLGAWPADLRRIALKLMTQVGAGGSVDVKDDPGRTVLKSRADYDRMKTSGAPPPPPIPDDDDADEPIEDDAFIPDMVNLHGWTEAMIATYERMGSPDVARFGEPLMVRVGDEVHCIYPNGKVATPSDGRLK
jgi:hypothetical protein